MKQNIDEILNSLDIDNIDNFKKELKENELYQILNIYNKEKIINILNYVKNIKNLFQYIKKEFLDKNKEFDLKDLEIYSNKKIITVFQPIVTNKSKIHKYEALMRYQVLDDNNDNKNLKFSSLMKFLTDYCNNQTYNPINNLLTKEILKLGISRKILNNFKMELSNELFKKNIIDSKKYIDELKLFSSNNNIKNINNSSKEEANNTKISINMGVSQLFSKDLFKKLFKIIEDKSLSADKINEIFNFIKKHIELELLEYPIKELDNKNYNNKTLTAKELILEENFKYIQDMGTKINLDDYTDIEHFHRRIEILEKIVGKNFTTIKVDAEIVKNFTTYQWLLNNQNSNDSELLLSLKTNPKIFNYYFPLEILNNLDLNTFKNEIKPLLISKANEGLISNMKVNYMNYYNFNLLTTKKLNKLSLKLLDNYNEKNLLLQKDNLKDFFDKIIEENNIIEKPKNQMKNIVYEYIEDKEIAKDLYDDIQLYFPKIKDKTSYQGFLYSKPLLPIEIINNNKINIQKLKPDKVNYPFNH